MPASHESNQSAALVWLKSMLPAIVSIILALLIFQYFGWSAAHEDYALAPSGFFFKMLSLIGINIIMATSLNIVNGYTGQFSLGHAGFMAIGAYAAGAITYYGSMYAWGSAATHGGFLGSGDWLFVAALLAGGLIAAAAGWVVGLPSLRLRGDYLAIVTLGFGEIVRVLITQTHDVIYDVDEVKQAKFTEVATSLGGALGFDGIPKYTNLFWIYVFAFLTIIVCYRLKQSIHGKAFLSVREDEIAAEAMGVSTTRYKVNAFVIAALLAGIGGGLYAHEVGQLPTPRELNFQKSIDFVVMVVLGGMGSISGAVLAAIFLTILPELLRNLSWVPFLPESMHDISQFRLIIYAVLLVVVMVTRPQGLFGIHEFWQTPLFCKLRSKLKGARE